ncbi:MAG: phosphodiester glycosidase family protein [Nocardioides sp.]
MRTFPSLAVACLLAILAPTALTGATSNAEPGADPHAKHRADPPLGRVIGTSKPQTSDRVSGAVARDVPMSLRAFRDTSMRAQWEVVPGVQASIWDQLDARGPIRAHLLAVDYLAPGVTVDYANDGAVKRTASVTAMLARDGAIAGVNGDFFDIGDTGAPLGIGRDRQRGLLNGRTEGWNSAFYIRRNGTADIGALSVRTTITEHPGIEITNVNSPEVQLGSVGLYTPAWGSTSGYRITGGQTKQVRMVRVERGRVVRNSVKLPSNTSIKGLMLVGRGPGAAELVRLKQGSKVSIKPRLQSAPKMAITGNKFLVRDGLIEVVDDREMHPRTAIGIDRDTHEILLLVIDGRQSFSRGYTMVELANLMIDLGADEALNLDGGGSSTMVAKRPSGAVGVINSPSDGSQRSVANAVGVTYTP